MSCSKKKELNTCLNDKLLAEGCDTRLIAYRNARRFAWLWLHVLHTALEVGNWLISNFLHNTNIQQVARTISSNQQQMRTYENQS
jgi:hypothetical protein